MNEQQQQNGTIALQTTENIPHPGQMQLNMHLEPQGVVFSFPVNLGIDNQTMAQFVKAYVQAHPELLEEIVRETVIQKKREMQIIQLVQQSRTER